jgi:CBS domain-containing protein
LAVDPTDCDGHGHTDEVVDPEPADATSGTTTKAACGSAESESTRLFHRVGAVIPEQQRVTTVVAGTRAGDALGLMQRAGFSQLPVVGASGEVVGLFSLRSFATAAIALPANRRPAAIAVEDAMIEPVWARTTDELDEQYAALDRLDCVLVGEPRRLLGVVTTIDVLRYLDRVAEPFVRIGELERGLRRAFQAAVDDEVLAELAINALEDRYVGRDEAPPARAVDMSLDELIAVVLHGPNWPRLQPVFGANRDVAATRLAELAGPRNAAMHFRRPLTDDELTRIRAARQWVALRLTIAGITDEDTDDG